MLLFKSQYVAPIVDGQKRVTRRRHTAHKQKQFPVGSVHGAYVRPPWSGGKPFAKLKVISVTVGPATNISLKEARLEGFDTVRAFKEAIAAMYGDTTADTPLLRIEFEVVLVDANEVTLFSGVSSTRIVLHAGEAIAPHGGPCGTPECGPRSQKRGRK